MEVYTSRNEDDKKSKQFPPETWAEYYERTKDRPPHALLLGALPFVAEREQALDLGAGALNESRALLEAGFTHVTAVDTTPVAQGRADTFSPNQFTYAITSFEEFNFEIEKYDLINAQYSLFFIRPDHFKETFKKITSALKPDGILVGQFLGDRDTFSKRASFSSVTSTEATDLLKDFDVVDFKEEEREGVDSNGHPKHIHLFHFIARK
jgi:tellurite methyltransferase